MDPRFMEAALSEARKASSCGEIPVGAVIVRGGEIVSAGHNLRERLQNSLYHAEIIAIDRACKALKTRRLSGCELYVTLEPCIMCAGAVINSGIKTVCFGAYDINCGACGISRNVFADFKEIEVYGGIMESECKEILSGFFKTLR